MKITYENEILVIEDYSGSFYDLAREINVMYPSLVTVVSRDILISASLDLKTNVDVWDTRKNITITGEFFLIGESSSFRLGDFYAYSNGNYRGRSGGELNLPNCRLIGSHLSNCGKVVLADIEMHDLVRWNIVGPRASLKIVDSHISGYGVFQGAGSILYNMHYSYQSSENGVLRPIGAGAIMQYIYNQGSATIDETTEPVAIVLNRESNTVIWEYGVVDNYVNLVKIMDTNADIGTLELRGCEVTNGYGISNTSNNKLILKHKYRFSGTLYDANGMPRPNVRMVVKNKLGEVEQNIYTNTAGVFNAWLTHYQNLEGQETTGSYMTPHTIDIEGSDSIRVNMVKNFEDVPLFAYRQDNELNLTKIIGLIEEHKKITTEQGEIISTDLNTIMNALAEKIKSNAELVKKGRTSVVRL